MGEYNKEGITGRDLMKFGAVSAAVGVAGSLLLGVLSADATDPL